MSQDALTPPVDVLPPPETNLGAVFTKPWVVDLVLDLAGYTADHDLTAGTAIEPSVGHGGFLVPMVSRLVESARRHGASIADTTHAIAGFDVDPSAVTAARTAVSATLTSAGVKGPTARRLARVWVRQADFLLETGDQAPAAWVLGNPPYVRVEEVDRDLMARYRSAWPAMSGRADLYVGFLQAGLSLLAPEGRLGVICADRWMRNQYGAALRAQIEDAFAMDACVIMHRTDAFEDKVAAYPAVTVIRRGAQGPALVCDAAETFDQDAGRRLLTLQDRGPGPVASDPDFDLSWTSGWFSGNGSWPNAHPAWLGALTELESRLPLLEDTGARVSVGVATGADDIYVTTAAARTEPDRLLKAVSAKETATGRIEWRGRYLVNPWGDDGLLPLDERPGMAAYLRRHAVRLKGRHVATKNPDAWWRTIDRVEAATAGRPKLLVPDLKDRIFPVYDAGEYYPGHSLYYITSDTWDLEVLGGLLMSDLATMFVEAYSVRMANGYLRVSAQYLRRVRVPNPQDIPAVLAEGLRAAFRARDVEAVNDYARTAYGPD